MGNMTEALGALAAVAAGVHHSGYHGLGGLGKAPRRGGRYGRAKNLRNLPAALQEAAKLDQKALRDRLKTAQQQAWSEFYAKYPGAIPLETRKIDRVVARFLIGQEETGTSPYVQSIADARGGTRLIVQGREVASRPTAYARFVKVCPGEFGVGKVDRATANSVLRMLQAGIHAADRQGKVFLAPSGKGGRIVAESCMMVEVNNKVRNAANKASSMFRSPFNPKGGGAFVPTSESPSYDAYMRMEGEAMRAAEREAAMMAPAGFRYPGT